MGLCFYFQTRWQRLLEIELNEIQELKENAENKNVKRTHKKNLFLKGKAMFSMRAPKCSKSSLLAYSQKDNFSALYHKHLTPWILQGRWHKYHSRYIFKIPQISLTPLQLMILWTILKYDLWYLCQVPLQT